MAKLHFGCGIRKIHGWINIDARSEVEPDLVYNLIEFDDSLTKFLDSEAVESIYSCHFLEHFTIPDVSRILNFWYTLLKPSGTLRISVPDFDSVCRHYMHHRNLSVLRTSLHGGQTHEFDYHKSMWDFASLFNMLERVGFKDIYQYDWRCTEHFYVDDHASAYLPHMDKLNGLLMSLNVEATKP